MTIRFGYSGTRAELEKIVETHDYDSPFVRQFYNRKARDINYNIKSVPVGWNHQKELVTIDFSHSKRIIFIAPPGRGKTFLLRALLGRLFYAGANVCVANDKKPEFFSSLSPVQSEFQKKLLPCELPKGLPVKNFFPHFLNKGSDKAFRNTEVFQLNLQDLDLSDMNEILNLNDPSGSRSIMIRNAFDKIVTGKIKTVKQLIQEFPNSIIAKAVESIHNAGVIGEEKPGVSFSAEMNKGNIPILNLYGSERFSHGVDYSLVYIAILLRKLYNDKRNNTLDQKKPLVIILDEMSFICPPDPRQPPSKKAIEMIISQGRAFKISTLMAAQVPEQIPDIIFKQSNMIFIPEGVDTKDAIGYVRRFAPSESDWYTVLARNMEDLLGSMNRFEWLMINRDKEPRRDQIEIISVASPTSKHLCEI